MMTYKLHNPRLIDLGAESADRRRNARPSIRTNTLWLLYTMMVAVFVVSGANALGSPPNESWFPKAPALPKASGQVIQVTTVDELFQAAKDVKVGGTISVADGRYLMPRYFAITTDNVTLRGGSGDRHKVIIDGASSRHGELIGITKASGVTIADLTVQNVKWNGIKINSNLGTDKVTIHNCVIHNIWQRGVKAPAMPKARGDHGPRNCRVQYCLFYNDRPKRFSDDETDTPDTFNGNYIGGIDVKNTINWTISDNVFIGIHGRTGEGRGCIYISENGRGCMIERNVFVDCDIAIALGNPSLGYSPLQAIDCIAQNNLVSQCPETGILACYTRDCRISNNTIQEADSRLKRLIWIQKSNDGLRVKDNVLIGPAILNSSKSNIEQSGNLVHQELKAAIAQRSTKAGQSFLPIAAMSQAIELPTQIQSKKKQAAAGRLKPGIQSPEVLTAMRKIHAGFKGQRGYVAQFGDSITYSMAFWSPMSWDSPERHLTQDDGLPKKPTKLRWRDYVKGARDKGPKHANYSGWRVGQVLNAMDAVLKRDKPEVAIIMVGTNDISGGRVPDGYRKGLEQVIRRCTAANCVPILNTIPPRRGHNEAVSQANKIIRDVAEKLQVPLVDFHAECLRRSGDSWDGTLISRDGVHPSGGKSNDYSEENLNKCGYALRNWINFIAYRQIYFRVLNSDENQN
jgi:hypothetical protein